MKAAEAAKSVRVEGDLTATLAQRWRRIDVSVHGDARRLTITTSQPAALLCWCYRVGGRKILREAGKDQILEVFNADSRLVFRVRQKMNHRFLRLTLYGAMVVTRASLSLCGGERDSFGIWSRGNEKAR